MTDEQAYETLCIGCWRESQCHEDMEYCDRFLEATDGGLTMHIIETCPKCGADLEYLTYTTNPPIPARRCPKCGWSWEGKPQWDQIIRVPFEPPQEAEQ